MKSAFDKIKAGLRDAEAYLDGERSGFVTHEVVVAEPDVRAIRARTGLSQDAFARSIGVAPSTLRNWEQGRRRPQGPARVLLALLDQQPGIIQERLGAVRR
ncbi:helix-turn-helix domain-containing protein [Candidatus Poriferisodalis sp.]|uniref:helix-turn-helix domain-containing protein n=1 Tax=Candidatus Poriferisodalis sp. TaxID=3101277 RepID=UPI003B0186AE